MTIEENKGSIHNQYNIGDWVRAWCDSDGQPFSYHKKETRFYRIVGKGNFDGEVYYILDLRSAYPSIRDYGFGHELRKYKDYSTCEIESNYPLSGVVFFVPAENIKEKNKNKDFPYHELEGSYLEKLKDGTIENYSAQRYKEFLKLAEESDSKKSEDSGKSEDSEKHIFIKVNSEVVGKVKEGEPVTDSPLFKNVKTKLRNKEEKVSPDFRYKVGDWVMAKCNEEGIPEGKDSSGSLRYYRIVGRCIYDGKVLYSLAIPNTPTKLLPTLEMQKAFLKKMPFPDYDFKYPSNEFIHNIYEDDVVSLVSNSNFISKLESHFWTIVNSKNAFNVDNVKKEESTMSKFVTEVKDDAVEASYRVAAHQLNKAARAAMVKFLKDSGAKRAQVKAFSDLMDTEGGLAALSVAIGWALTYIPALSENPKARRLAKEFRVNGMTIGGNMLVGGVMTQLLPALLSQLDALPDPGKVRVATESLPEKSQAVTFQEEDETATVSARKTNK